MAASASTVPVAVVYLILVFFAGFGAPESIDADYLQDGVPALAIEATRERSERAQVYRIVARPVAAETAGDGQPSDAVVVRVEQSDLVSQNYLIYEPGRQLPLVVTLEPVLAQLAVAALPSDLTLELAGDEGPGGAAAVAALPASLHALRREGATVLSAPDAGILLLIEHE